MTKRTTKSCSHTLPNGESAFIEPEFSFGAEMAQCELCGLPITATGSRGTLAMQASMERAKENNDD